MQIDNFLNTRFYLNGSDNWDLIDSNGVLIHHSSTGETRYGPIEAVAMFEFPEGSRKFREALNVLYDYPNKTLPEHEAKKHLLNARIKWLDNIRKYGEKIDLTQIGKPGADFLGKELAMVFTEEYMRVIKPYISACNFSPVGIAHARITGIERTVETPHHVLGIL